MSMRYKYVEELYPTPHVFAGSLVTGFNTNTREKEYLIEDTTKEQIIELMANEHKLVLEKLSETACAWSDQDHEAFTKFWYGDLTPNPITNEDNLK